MCIDIIKGINGCVCLVLFEKKKKNQGYFWSRPNDLYGGRSAYDTFCCIYEHRAVRYSIEICSDPSNLIRSISFEFVLLPVFQVLRPRNFNLIAYFSRLFATDQIIRTFSLRLGVYFGCGYIDILVHHDFKWRLILNVA